MAKIVSAAAASPGHRYSQAEVREACRALFPALMGRAERAGIFDHAGVQSRALVEPLGYYRALPPFSERNAAYLRHALPLAEAAVRGALGGASLGFEAVDHIVSVTTTGLLTPSLDAHLAQALPFSRQVKRTPVFGSGCAGGAVALARAADYLAGHPDEAVLVLSVELCSLTFLPAEGSMTQLVAAALFGDGASAAVLVGDRHPAKGRAAVLASGSRLLPDSLDAMGWEFSDAGMRLLLAPRVPGLVERGLRPAVDPFLARRGLRVEDMASFLLHPGSAKVLDACERALGRGPESVAPSRAFLAGNGNVSSSCLLYILRDALAAPRPGPALMAAFGPGFACEMLLLDFA